MHTCNAQKIIGDKGDNSLFSLKQ